MCVAANRRLRVSTSPVHAPLAAVEAKAHDVELIHEEGGKKLDKEPTKGQLINHQHIEQAIDWANRPLTADTPFSFSLTSAFRYQMSNRFASAIKLTQLGYPVILVYLGFLDAEEMRSSTRTPFAHPEEWSSHVKAHSKKLFPDEVWNKRMTVFDKAFIPLIRSARISYDKPCETLEVFA